MPVIHFAEHERGNEHFREAESPKFYKAAHFLVKKFVETRLQINYYGLENIPDRGPAIFAPNHDTAWDPPLMGLAVGEVDRPLHFLAKKELWNNRLLGYALTRLGQIPIDRESSSDLKPIRVGTDLLNNGRLLGIFPDGTRAKSGIDDYDIRSNEMKKGVALFSVNTGSRVHAVGIDIEKSPVSDTGKSLKMDRKRIASVVIDEGIGPNPELKGRQARNEMVHRVGNRIAQMHNLAKSLTEETVDKINEAS